MKINREEFEKIAALSALEFSEEEAEDCKKGLEEIIELAEVVSDYVQGSSETIKNVDTTEISSEELREDILIPSMEAERVLANGKNDGRFFVVDRIKK